MIGVLIVSSRDKLNHLVTTKEIFHDLYIYISPWNGIFRDTISLVRRHGRDISRVCLLGASVLLPLPLQHTVLPARPNKRPWRYDIAVSLFVFANRLTECN